MSKCRYGKAALLYPNGMLSHAEKKRFEKHLSACAECRAAVENEMEIRSLYAEAAPAAPSASRPGSSSPRMANSSRTLFWRRRQAPPERRQSPVPGGFREKKE